MSARQFFATLLLATISVALTLVAEAQDDRPAQKFAPELWFRLADADKNGKISKEELEKFLNRGPRGKDAPGPQLLQRLFQRLDSDGDGAISQDEFRKWAELRRGGFGEGLLKSRPNAKGLADPPTAKPEVLPAKSGTRPIEPKSSEKSTFPEIAPQPKAEEKSPSAEPATPPKTEAKSPSAEPAAPPKTTSTPSSRSGSGDPMAFFEKKIRPVLVEHCYACHCSEHPDKVKANLVLDTRDGVRQGGDSGPAIVPGKPKQSLLLKAIQYHDDLKMPPKGKLPEAVVADFQQWIEMGAPDPRDGKAKVIRQEIDIVKGREFWAFQPPQRSEPPQPRNATWAYGDIDRYILAQLEARDLQPVADADENTLMRRLYFDLIGLPPTPEEIQKLTSDRDPKKWENLVDRLLASPAFGERWGRHWLDVARYAESSGRQVDIPYPHAWRYRDYVIQSFHADKPYPQFIREQLAGDLLPAKDEKHRAELLIATGFLAIGPKAHNERNPAQFAADLIDEQIDTVSQAFLGLTAACARCHDHKFDPIPMKDYYALAGIFRSTETCFGTLRVVQNVQTAPLLKLSDDSGVPKVGTKMTAAQRDAVQKQLEAAQQEFAEALKTARQDGGVRLLFLRSRISQLEDQLRTHDPQTGEPYQYAMGVRDRYFPGDARLLIRGEVDKPGETVPRGFLQVLTPTPVKIGKTSGRLELADWIASESNPLTARVMVNRIWLHLFGRGIVATPDNFGNSGALPSHPQLLDYLALRFMQEGWSVKKLIREIVLSRTYRLSSQFHAGNYEKDPDNVFLWRQSKRRLDAEAIRDAMLAVSGNLSRTPPIGSPVARGAAGSFPMLPRPGFRSGEPMNNYRSVYLPIIRDQVPEALALFDFADASAVHGDRPTTSVPAQALYLLNNPFVLQQAESAAERLYRSASSDAERLQRAYLLFYGRTPRDSEVQTAQRFLNTYRLSLSRERLSGERATREAWTALCQAMMASAEFLYLN